jgi:predicted homoserine dehydrogenase-like protein
MSILNDLTRRERLGHPVRIAIVGTGFFGGGLVRRIAKIPGLVTAVAANRTLERAIAALQSAGVARASIRVCDDPEAAQAALDSGLSVATSVLDLPARVPGVDVVMEATGDVLVGTRIALASIEGGKHIVAANPETQATVGPYLHVLAERAGVVYSDVDGDEPGILKGLIDYCVGLGFDPVLAGNCKGVLKRYATPETQAAFAAAHDLKPWIATAAADGTKLNFELATIANATGLVPAVRGMTGVQTTLDTLVEDFGRAGLLDLAGPGPIVDYSFGIPNGVFVVVREDDPAVRREMRYLKMGDGPFYLFHHPRVMVHYEAPLSAAWAALHGAATVAPRGAPVAEVAAFAKRDLEAGQRLDGIGGFDCYGLIVKRTEARREGLLPVGLASFARLTRPIAKDQPIPREAVAFEEENIVLDLHRRQEAHFA